MSDQPQAAFLDRAALLTLATVSKPKVQAVELPDGAGRVYVRVMMGVELDAYQVADYERDKVTGKLVYRGRNSRGRLAALCLCDENGKRLFPNEGEADLLGKMPAPILDAIYQAAEKLNGLDAASKEDRVKNSEPPEATNASGSDSPGTSGAA
jgi:hypothetical protein